MSHTRALPILLSLVFMLVAIPDAIAQGRNRGDRWSRLKRWDTNDDGEITREEFQGPDRFFKMMDSDGDGKVTEKEASSRRSGGDRGSRGSRGSGLESRIDLDRNGQISGDEWAAFFAKADENEDGILQREEWDAATSGRKVRDSAPKVGASTPKVSAKKQDGRGDVDLSKLKRVTVLVFGSYT